MKSGLERRGQELGLEAKEAVEEMLRIEDLPDEGLLLHLQRPPNWLAEDVRLASGVEGWILLFKIAQEVTIDAECATSMRLECGRCLNEYQVPVELKFRLMYLPMKDQEFPEEKELVADDLGVSFYRKPEIQMRDLFREELILSIPLQPLCRPDCPGLCPSCGADLSTTACGCRSSAPDARFSALAGLLQTMKDQPKTNRN